MRLTMAPYCAAINPAACVPAIPSACTVWSSDSPKIEAAAAAAGNTARAPECQPWAVKSCPMHMPTRGETSNAATAAVSRCLAADAGPHLGERHQHRQSAAVGVHAAAVRVVQFEALYQAAVDKHCMGRGKPLLRAPDTACARIVELGQGIDQDFAVFRQSAVYAAAQTVQDHELDPLAHLGRNIFIAQSRYEGGNAARVRIAVFASPS